MAFKVVVSFQSLQAVIDTDSVDAHNIEARYQKGLLTLTLAKRAKRIEIKVA